jgi:DNA-binding transcriptional LysR family regulator
MDRFAELRAFCLVASSGGFSAAGRELGVATSSVARLVDALEERIGAPLLNRSTRSVTLTGRGALYFEQASAILDQLDAADDAAAADNGGVQGLLRVSAPVTFSTMFIAPLAGELHRRHPRLELDLRLSDSVSNMVDESIDVAVRIGAIEDHPNLIVRRLMDHERVICASPAYFAKHGAPIVPADLATHNCLRFAYDETRTSWRLQRGQDVDTVAVRGTLIANNAEVLCQAALAGVGVVLLPKWLVSASLASGALVQVLADYRANPGAMNIGLYAIYQVNRRGSPKVKAFIDLLANHLTGDGRQTEPASA